MVVQFSVRSIHLSNYIYISIDLYTYIYLCIQVHHVNGEGENGGVVYCEMQGTENVGESRTHRGYKITTLFILKGLYAQFQVTFHAKMPMPDEQRYP